MHKHSMKKKHKYRRSIDHKIDHIIHVPIKAAQIIKQTTLANATQSANTLHTISCYYKL